VEDDYDWFFALFDGGNAVLKLEDVAAEVLELKEGGQAKLVYDAVFATELRTFAVRAGSVEVRVMEPWDAALTSRPAVKARSPAPVRITERMSGSWERRRKTAERLSHILGRC